MSAAVFAPLVSAASSRGAQLFGPARTIERDQSEAEIYWEAIRWQSLSQVVELDHRSGAADTQPGMLGGPRQGQPNVHWRVLTVR